MAKWARPLLPFLCKDDLLHLYQTKELRYLLLKHISMEQNIITVPASIAKNKKSLPISIDASLRSELKELKLSSYSNTDYLLGSTKTIISEKRIGENTPYNRFQKCLKATKLDNKKLHALFIQAFFQWEKLSTIIITVEYKIFI